jgi:hypothetical protein
MGRQCLFCDRKADSREHLWAAWILERVKKQPIRHSIGKSPVKTLARPEMKIRTVCEPCNNGWMSALEEQNIPLMACLLQDISAPLDASQQSSLAVWTLKTAMVLDSMNKRDRSFFYERSECEKLRLTSTIPARTNIWIGRYSMSGLGAFGTDLWIVMPDGPRIAKGCATTIIVGHLAIQVLAIHVLPEYKDRIINEISPKAGQWDDLLLPIWPVGSRPVTWPPRLTFTNSGSLSIAHLMERWRIGKAA